jgi:hypothetical protein
MVTRSLFQCCLQFYISHSFSTKWRRNSVEEENKEGVAKVHLDQPYKERKSKKADKDRAKKAVSGKDSMAPPNKRSHHNFADITPQENIPGPNASSSFTHAGENQHPTENMGTTVSTPTKIHGNPLGTSSCTEGSLPILRVVFSKTMLWSLLVTTFRACSRPISTWHLNVSACPSKTPSRTDATSKTPSRQEFNKVSLNSVINLKGK